MQDKEIDKILKELAVSSAWADDFASAIKSDKDIEVLKEASNLKNQKGERLYDNFQLFQFLGESSELKLELAKKILKENPEYSTKNFNMPVINYIIQNRLAENEIDTIIKNL